MNIELQMICVCLWVSECLIVFFIQLQEVHNFKRVNGIAARTQRVKQFHEFKMALFQNQHY